MNSDELKANWEAIHKKGLSSHAETEMEQIIRRGASDWAERINKKLFREMAITAFAAIVSALGVIFFYAAYDPTRHAWIDPSKLLPVQLLGFALFLLLFVFGCMEYHLVNRRFPAQSIRTHLTSLLRGLKTSHRSFVLVALPVLCTVYFLEFSYFLEGYTGEGIWIQVGGSLLLTALSYLVIVQYHQRSLRPYLTDLERFQKELEASEEMEEY